MRIRINKKYDFVIFLFLLILMPFHYTVFTCIFSNIKVLSLWRDVIIGFLFVVSMKNLKITKKVPDITIAFSVMIFLLYALRYFSSLSINVARIYIMPLLVYFYVSRVRFSKKEKLNLLKVIWAVAVFESIYGIFQAYILKEEFLIKMGYPEWNGLVGDTSFYIGGWLQQRVVGTFASPTACATYLAILFLILITFSKQIKGNCGKRFAIIFDIGLLLVFFALLLTFTRSAWVGCILGLVLVKRVTKKERIMIKKRYMIFFVGLFIIFIVALALIKDHGIELSILNMLSDRLIKTINKSDASLVAHLEALYTPVKLVFSHPFGLGFAKNGPFVLAKLDVSQTNQVESSFWTMAYDIGIFGMIIYFSSYIVPLIESLRNKSRIVNKATARVTICVLFIYLVLPQVQTYEVAVMSIVIIGLFNNKTFNSDIIDLC